MRERANNRHATWSTIPQLPAELPKIFFCGDPHGAFDYINEVVERERPDAIVILGDIQPYDRIEKLLGPAMALTEIWWIPGNHDTDTEEFYDRLWHGPLAKRNLHGRVGLVKGVAIAGLGGVFRGQIWMPEGEPNYRSVSSFVRRAQRCNLWRGGLPRRHRSSIFPNVYEGLMARRAHVLVTHEAAGCHKKGFSAIDRLGRALHCKWMFHGHQHEDHEYGMYKGMLVRGIGYRGIVDLNGNVIRPSELDPRDAALLQAQQSQSSEEGSTQMLANVTSATSVVPCESEMPNTEIKSDLGGANKHHYRYPRRAHSRHPGHRQYYLSPHHQRLAKHPSSDKNSG